MQKNPTMNIVYDNVKHDIIYMILKPNDLISEIEISKKYNVSRTPVRDAFKKLVSEDLLEVRPQRGTFVSKIDLDAINDIMFMRDKIEVSIVRNLVNRISDIQMLTLLSILKKQEKLLDVHNITSEVSELFLSLDNEFHETIFSFEGKTRVWELLSNIQVHYLRFRVFIDHCDHQILTGIYNDHLAIFECLKFKDISKLEDIYSKHLYNGVKNQTIKIFENADYFKNF